MLDLLSVLIEEGCSQNMMIQYLEHHGMSEKTARRIIAAHGIGQERKHLAKKAESWSRARFNSSR